MRIGLITTEYPPFFGGGIGTYCGSFARALTERGHEVHVLVPGTFSGAIDGVTVHPFALQEPPADLTFANGLRAFGDAYERTFHLAARLREFVRETEVEVIESQEYLGLLYQSLYDRFWRPDPITVPSIVTLHGGSFDLFEANGLPRYEGSSYVRWFVEDRAIQWADAVVAPSRWLADRTSRRLALPGDRVHVCPYPFEVPETTPVGREACEVLFVGRLERRKGVEILARALPAVFQALPSCRVRFLGADLYDPARTGSVRGWMERRLSEFSDRLIFEGRQPPERIAEAMARATVVVIPSTWENFPNVCLEACAAGAPILASDNNGIAEILEDGRSGVLFRNGDPDSLSTRLIEMLRLDPGVRDCFGRQARTRVRTLCDPDRVIDDRIRHFRSVIEQTRSRGLPSYPRQLLGRGAHPRPHGDRPERLAVVIPCYNMGETLVETVDSVRRSTRPADEVVVVDDGSNDPRTREILAGLGPDVRVVRSENRGLSAARNLGAASTTADTLLFLDADDLIHPEFVETAWPILERHADVGVVMPWADAFGASQASFCYPVPHFPLLLHRNLSTSSVGLIRRAAFNDVGGYKTEMTYGLEDWQFWIALLDAGWGALNIPLRMLQYRVRPDSMFRAINDQAHGFLLEQLVTLTPRPYREHFDACRFLDVERHATEHAAGAVVQQLINLGGNVSIYGASSGGRLVLQRLQERGVRVKQFVDRDQKLWGSRVASIPVCSLSDAITAGDTVFVIGSMSFGDEMTRTIQDAFTGRAERPHIFRW